MFDPNKYLDFHTHKQRHAANHDVLEIVSTHPGKEKNAEFFTIGHHPWWIEKPIDQDQKAHLTQELERENCLALGEIGLDKFKGPTLVQQSEILKSQLIIADELQLSVVIHCVRTTDLLIEIKKQFPNIKHWCIHGYGRNATLALQLIQHGFDLSIMPSIPNDKLESLISTLPKDRLFLETDSMPDTDIIAVYNRVATVCNWDIQDLKMQMMRNAAKFFNRTIWK